MERSCSTRDGIGRRSPVFIRPAPGRLTDMYAVVFEQYGGPGVLEYKEVPDPTPGDGRVLVDVEAVGVNYRDVYERNGAGYGSEPPAVIGVEGAGTVVESGERVAWVGVPGSYAERVAADPAQLVPLPDGISAEV